MRSSFPTLSIAFLIAAFIGNAQPLNLNPAFSALSPGKYYFFAPWNMQRSHHLILDGNGSVVFRKSYTGQVIDFKMQRNGQISYVKGGKYMLADGNVKVVDSVNALPGASGTDEHDFQVLPNGNYLLMGFRVDTMDLSSYNVFLGNQSPGSKRAAVKSVVVQELDAAKNLVFEWRSINHLPFNSVDPFFISDTANVDWTHSNAIELDQDGNYLLSSRHINEITKIDRNTGTVMWRFGGAYNQFTFIGDTVPFYGQHDIRRLPNGHITLWDNGRNIPSKRHAARALEYEINESALTAKLVWKYSYDSTTFSSAMGNVQTAANGNRLINFGSFTKSCFVVVDSMKNKLFEMPVVAGYQSYRTFMYDQLPVGFIRPQLVCFDSAGVLQLAAPAGYLSYQWNTGSSGSKIDVTEAGDYDVMLERTDGAFVRSEPVKVMDPAQHCLPAALTVNGGNRRSIYPNPSDGFVTVEGIGKNALRWLDLTGRVVEVPCVKRAGIIDFDLSQLQPGVYFVGNEDGFSKVIRE